MTETGAEKVDLFKLHKDEYVKPKKPKLIDVGKAKYLLVDGTGAPGEEVFQERIGALYGMAYTMKFTSKFAGRDYAVGKLEALYGIDGQGPDLESIPRDEWRWRMLIRVPEFITKKDLDAARRMLREKGKEGDFDAVRLETVVEGRCVQVLHVGPYEAMQSTGEAIDAFCEEQGLKPRLWQHQIYLSDPRRMAPEKLKTILRHPVS